MNIEKTYGLMNKLQVFKNLLKSTQKLKVELNKNTYRYYVNIFSNITDVFDCKQKDELSEEIKNVFIPVLESKIKELEKEIKSQK